MLVRRCADVGPVALVDADIEAEGLLVADEALDGVGSRVWAVGHTYGMPWMISDGIVSKIRYWPPNEFGTRYMVMTTAWVAGGNSGGPLFDAKGRVIGMVLAFFSKDTQASQHITICLAGSEMLRFLKDF